MPLDFPTSPTIGQSYSLTGRTWIWDGSGWTLTNVGTQGATGATGPAGTPGTAAPGTPGATGATGAPGTAGSNGTIGVDGATGATGPAGTAGSPGTAGATGATGTAGTPGSAGATGATGIAGGVSYSVTNSGASSYLIAGSSNPTLTLVKGFTYYFVVSASGHPFWIKTAQVTGTGSAYTSGVTNNGVDSGTISFTVPFDAPATLYYICQFHGSMTGTLTIADTAIGATGVTGPTGATGPQGATGAPGTGASLTKSMLYSYNLLFGG